MTGIQHGKVTRRNSEGQVSSFRKQIEDGLRLVDLQGLLIGKDGKFTEAVEAFEIESDKSGLDLKSLFSPWELFVKVKLAEALKIPFSIWAHTSGRPEVLSCEQIGFDQTLNKIVTINKMTVSERVFLDWWGEKKGTLQSKKFEEDYIDDSYFDDLLASDDKVWGGNVDGIYYDSATGKIRAILEFRCTKKNPIERYDPAYFIRKDFHTWKPVVQLARELSVPCILITFQKEYKNKDEKRFGATVVEEVTRSQLRYRNNMKPYQHFMHSAQDFREYLDELWATPESWTHQL